MWKEASLSFLILYYVIKVLLKNTIKSDIEDNCLKHDFVCSEI